jgi:hypothetical protein
MIAEGVGRPGCGDAQGINPKPLSQLHLMTDL